jgi:superfamily II DNA or RNA helicase
MIVKMVSNAVHARLVEPSKEVRLFVADVLSYAVDGYEHMTKRPGWDGRSSFYSFKTNSFPAGFTHMVKRKLIQAGFQVHHVSRPLPAPLGPENPEVDSFGFDPRYSYQMDTVRKLEKHGMIVAQLATGAGKSRVGRLAYARIRRKTLFLTTRAALMYQFAEACVESFGEKEVGIVGDSVWQADRPLICGMVQTLAARLANHTEDELIERHLVAQVEREKKEQDALTARMAKAKKSTEERTAAMKQLKKEQANKRLSDDELAEQISKKLAQQQKNRAETLELLRGVEFVIAEEAHEAGGNSYFDLMQACVNANYRLALTATPFMRPDAESNMRLMAVTGGIGIRVTEKQLIDLGILATPIFQICRTKKPPRLFRSTAYTRAYEIGIVEHDWRNKRIVAECIRMSRYGLTTMILVQRRAHGERLAELLGKVKLKAEFINGDDDASARKRALGRLGRGEISVLIGTNILDVGVDVPSVGCIVLAGGGKAEVANRQRIGRGLRAKKIGPNICFVLDFMDEHNSHLQGHAIQRREIIVGTPGFAENLLAMDVDWRLTDYGFIKL